jgi:mycothiol synthase
VSGPRAGSRSNVADVEIRPAGEEDAEAAYAVLVACDLGRWFDLALEQFRAWWPTYRGTWVAEEGNVVGFAAARSDEVEVYVVPEARRRGIGTRLLAKAEAAAEEHGVTATARRDEPAAAPFLERHGYRFGSETWLMQIDLDRERPKPAWPEGIAVRSFRVEDARAVKELLDVAYAKEPDFREEPFEEWSRFMLDDTSFEAESWFVAEAVDGSLAGAALNWKEGYVKDLVVHPAHRSRGLGEALMLHTFRHFEGRGAPNVTLKTDSNNTSQAWRLYERLGMRKIRTYDVFEKRR